MSGLSGRIALVTGASQGIGRACALELAKAGATVALAARNVEKLEAVAGEIAAAGGTAKAFALDVASEESIKACAKAVIAEFGTPEQKDAYCTKMFGGTWGGTMCLTEPHAGSDVGSASSTAKKNADGSYTITNVHSGLRLDTSGSGTGAGTLAVQASADSSSTQDWTLVPEGSNYYEIENKASGLLLGVSGEDITAGADALIWTNNGTSDHLWQLIAEGGGEYKIENYNSGLMLGVNGESTASGAQVLQWTDNGTPDHLWTLAAT